MARRSIRGPKWRIPTGYIGAGSIAERGGTFLVNTESGVQAVDREGNELFHADLGKRCLGVVNGRGDETVATCLDGLYSVDGTGKRLWGTHSQREIIHEPIPLRDGFVLASIHSLHFLRDGTGSQWRFDLRELLGPSVEALRLVGAFELDGSLVVGAVDVDSGIGRVVVLGENGQRKWVSDPGPLSSLFPAGSTVFVWCQSGYGQFESRMVRTDGKEIWRVDFAGTGAHHADGSISMLVGSNESPTWDNWEYRRLSASGRTTLTFPAHGHASLRPIVASDGAVYFTGYFRPIDPNESRTDYTSYFPMPAALVHGHLTGASVQPTEYHLTFQRVTPAGELEVLGEETESLSFSRPLELAETVVFTSQGDLVAYRKL